MPTKKIKTDFEYKGIKRIEIPKIDADFYAEDFGASIIKKYLPFILKENLSNAKKIDYLYNYYLGEQDILSKKRLYNKDADNNNITVENHALRLVDFNTGIITSEQREYTHKVDTDSDDLKYLDRYFTDINFYDKDIDLKTWVFATGIGITYSSPRTDIIVSDGIDKMTGIERTRYMTESEGFDIKTQAPFEFEVIDPRENFVVYSSGFDKKPLFCVSIVDRDVSKAEDKNPIIHKEIHIETRYASFVIESDTAYKVFYPNSIEDLRLDKKKVLNYLPLIEYSINNARLGVIEKTRDVLNHINVLKSSMADMIVDNANAILVFKNTDIDSNDVQDMKKAGAIIINDNNNGRSTAGADLDTITVEIPFSGLTSYYEGLLSSAYDIAGVPLASGQVSSGGSNNEAVKLGGGWQNAYIVAKSNIIKFVGKDYEQLSLFLKFCKEIPNCPIDNLAISQIAIKYRINQSDNFLNKAQGILNLYNCNMPYDMILQASELFSDVTSGSKKWKGNDELVKSQQKTTEVIETKKEGNNSQE